MKTRSLMVGVCLSLTLGSRAQTGSLAAPTNASAPQDTPYEIVSQDANSCVWQCTNYETGPDGQSVPRIHSYTELATGLHYWTNGEWVDSKEVIVVLPQGGAEAVQGQHQVYFPADIYSGAVEIVTPDGTQLKSRPMGISYYDGTNSVLIAELTNSVGQLISSNQVIYTNAFTDFPADLLMTYRKSGFECDLVFRSQIPDPQSFGLSVAATRLELLTEFFDTPDPIQTQTTSVGGISDATLGFGQMKMVRGKAFQIGTPDAASPDMRIPVGKTWTSINGQTFLIEEVSYPQISPQLNSLPALANTLSSSIDPVLHKVSASRLLPLARTSRPATNTMKVAKADFHRKTGVVLDYALLNGTATNFTFQGDTTYLISGVLNGYGTTTFEGGTVIKYDSTQEYSSVQLWGNVNFATAPYRPAIFTSCDDNTVGESIVISNAPMFYYDPLAIDAGGGNVAIQNARFSYMVWGVHPYGENFTLNNAQFIHCGNALYPEYVTATLNNILMDDVTNALGGINYSVAGCQMTIAGCGKLATTWGSPSNSSVTFTNSLLVNITNNGTVSCTSNSTVMTTNQIFQSVGAGSFYLATNSHYAGTTNIDPTLLAALQQKTTYPPIVFSNISISTNLTLVPQAPRDTNTTGPDMGYHYDPIDYLFDQVWVTNCTLTVTNGAVLAGYNDWDIHVSDGSSVVSFGSPLAPNWFTRYSCVQDQSLPMGNYGNSPSSTFMISPFNTMNGPAGFFRFTKFSCPACGGYHLYDDGQTVAYSNLWVQDCEFWSGTNDFSGNNNTTAVLKNNLFARSGVFALSTYTNYSYAVSNNLFWNMAFTVHPGSSSNLWFFFNNDFDNCTLSVYRSIQPVVNGYNAYLVNTNRLIPTNAFDIVTTNDIAYQPWLLGTFYQPTNSILTNAGSCTGGAAGLYEYTTTTNQVIEGNSPVDIGYHYVALDGNGNPIDSNGDGIPDYLEDANGNGVVDLGELPFGVTIDNPVNGSIVY